MLTSIPIADIAGAFWDSTAPGKIIVILLFLGSAWAWTIMVTKGWQLKLASEATQDLLEAFRSERSPTALFTKREDYPGTPLNTIYRAGCTALGGELQAYGIDPDDLLMGDMTSEAHRRLHLNQLETL